MSHNIYIYIIIMALVSYIIRALPLTIIRKPIKNEFINSFLYYIPYVTLSVMTFPAIIEITNNQLIGLLALISGIIVAYKDGSLFKVATTCCIVVFILELII